MALKDFAGGAVETTLSANIGSGDTAATIAAATNWPSGGAAGTFGIAIGNIDPTSRKFTTNVEKIRVGARTGTSLSSMTRGVDGTSALSHTAGETVRHILLAEDIDEVNAHMFDTGRDDHTQYHTAARHAAVSHTSAMLGTDSVGTDEIAANAVTSSELATGAVTAGKIATGGISAAAQFAAGVVDAAAIGADQVGTSEIAPLAVTAAEIAANTITAGKIAGNTITSAEIAADAIGASELANNAVDTAAIVDDAVTDAKIENDFARGIIAQQILTSDNGPHTTDAVTDMLLNNVSVVQNHVYAVHLHVFCGLSSAGNWRFDLWVNGALYDCFQVVRDSGTLMDGTVYWTAPATQATDDFVVRVDEVSAGGDLTLSAAATLRRSLTITDLGVI